MNKLSQWWKKISLSTKLAVVLLPSVATGTIILMIFLNLEFHASFLNSNYDVSGWGSLVIGSAIGIYITFAILIYSNTSQKKTDDIIKKISDQQNEISILVEDIKKIEDGQQKIIKEQEEFITKKRNQAYTGLNGNICALRFSVRSLEREFDLYQNEKLTKEEYLKQIQEFLPYVKNSLENLQNYCDVREQYLDEEILNNINKLLIDGNLYCQMGQQSREFFDPTLNYPKSINQIWSMIPDPYKGYDKLKDLYGWNT